MVTFTTYFTRHFGNNCLNIARNISSGEYYLKILGFSHFKTFITMSSMKFLLILFLFVVVAAANYCDEKLCSPGKKHVCCNHSNKFSSRCPKGVKLFNFDKKYIKLSEDERNKLRNATANGNVDGLPQASKMPTIVIEKKNLLRKKKRD